VLLSFHATLLRGKKIVKGFLFPFVQKVIKYFIVSTKKNFILLSKGCCLSEFSKIKLHTVFLLQKDLQKAVAFYQLLGFTCSLYKTGKWAEFKVGSISLALCPSDKMESGHTGLVFAVADLKEISLQLQKLGYPVTDQIKTGQGMVITVTDPGGNDIDLIYPEVQKPVEIKEDYCCGTSKS